MNIHEPVNLFARPFADNGNKTIIPADGDVTTGRASLENGFPIATQTPVHLGGVAPNRLDFNGIFYMLSAFALFAQTGGIFTYKDTLDYGSPSVVFYNNMLWYCLKANGPASTVIAPGEDSAYWQTFGEFVYEQMQSSGIQMGVDVGDVKMHYGTEAPDGWFVCDNSIFDTDKYPKLYAKLGTDHLPDFRGLVPRGYDPDGINDPDGENREIGSIQTDAGRKVSGKQYTGNAGSTDSSGSFRYNYSGSGGRFQRPHDGVLCTILDSTFEWGEEHTSTEFRGANFCILFCIKHD